MPPWAHTLCDRFTGTRLIRSTSIPSSASFMAAAKPARPPPTIRTRCFAIERVQGSGVQDRGGCRRAATELLFGIVALLRVGIVLIVLLRFFNLDRKLL